MALRIPIVSDWASAQQAFDFIAQRFPLGRQDIANGAVGTTQLSQQYVVSKSTAHPYSLQAGQTTIAALAQAGQQNVNITLPSAWTTAHVAFTAALWPASTLTGFTTVGSIQVGTGTGQIVFFNTTTAQNVTVSWFSFGY